MDSDKLRRRIAFEAARLLHARRESNFTQAKWRAARSITRSYIRREALPTDMEIRSMLQQLIAHVGTDPFGDRVQTADSDRLVGSSGGESMPDVRQWGGTEPDVSERDQQADGDALCERFLQLLLPLDRVKQDPDYHPEGDVLYHSLQVFELAREARPWDAEFLQAALLHDVGKGIDPYDHVQAGLAALEPIVSQRTLWLIENHDLAHRISEGTIGVRARRRIRQDDSAEELELLAACDREGRVPGRRVCSAEDAVTFIQQLADGEAW
jgi:predicted HD phosphohydrolase